MTICIVTFKVWDTYDHAYNKDRYKIITRKYPQKLNNKYLTKFDYCQIVLAEFDRDTIVKITSIVEEEI